jgi:transcriptional regulator of NAD metabolism
MSQDTAWDEVLKKEASGVDNCDLGNVRQVEREVIVTEKGVIHKKRYRIPKNLIAGFDGNTLYFRIMKAEAKRFRLAD